MNKSSIVQDQIIEEQKWTMKIQDKKLGDLAKRRFIILLIYLFIFLIEWEFAVWLRELKPGLYTN